MYKRNILLIAAICGLVMIFLVTVFYAWDQITFRSFSILLLAGTLIWFSGILAADQIKKKKSI
jgi:hypothetical protein